MRAGLAALLSSVILPVLGESTIDLKTLEVSSRSRSASHVLTDMKKVCESLHLKFPGPTEFSPTWGCLNADYNDMMGTGTEMRLDSSAYSFDFKDSDGRLTSYQYLDTDKLPENQVYTDPPDQPKWTSTQAIEIGTLFEKILVAPKDCFLGEPAAEYVHGAWDDKKAQRGIWYVSWPRVDSRGHPFYGDHVTLQIQEGYAPLGAGVYLTSPFAEEKTQPLKLDDAILKARAALASKVIDRGFELYDVGDTLVENKFNKADLMVVMPAKDPKVLGGPSTGIARLAWVIWFVPQHSKKPAHSLYDDSFSVWVDAHNGKILGTDGWL
jgi:hypothetical protein